MDDFSDVLCDPEMCDDFTVVRRKENVNNFGESALIPKVFECLSGIIGPMAPKDLQRIPEGQRMQKSITVISEFHLQGPSPGYQPDIVKWHGDSFVVATLDDFTRFGYVQALCVSMDIVDAAPGAPNA